MPVDYIITVIAPTPTALPISSQKGIAAYHVFGYNSSLVGESSSGRTTDSESVSGGSNPPSPATLLIGTQVAGRTATGKTKGEGQRLPL